jgi:hypothetical protein
LRKEKSFKILRKTRSKKEIRPPYVCRETMSTRMKMRDPHQEKDEATRQLMISDDTYFNRRLTLEKKSEKAISLKKSNSQNRFSSRLRLSKIDLLPPEKKKKS